MAVMSKQTKAVGALVVTGGVLIIAGRLLRQRVKEFQREQTELYNQSLMSRRKTYSMDSRKVAVDITFGKRLMVILSLCVPHVWSKEAFFIIIQSFLLYSRTLLSDWISSIEGEIAQCLISKNWSTFVKCLATFALTAFPAATVNSGLKAMRNLISLSFQEVLTKHLHQAYLTNRVYYTATILGGLSNPDQRITEDVAKFCSSISELHSQTFKPVLDVILFSKALAKTIRYKGQFVLYAYFILSSMVLRSISPPLALLTAQEAALSGNFRNAHQRIVAHAEEIAFNDPPGGKTECLILNDHLHKLIRHSQLSVAQRFLQQIADGYIVKYMATVIGFCVFAAPFYFAKEAGSHLTTGEYVRSVRLLTNSSDAIGQLILVYKRVTTLAGYTSRVSELLESVNALGRKKELLPKNISSNVESKPYLEGSSDALPQTPTIIFGNLIKFEKVTIYSPDHTLLVHELSFEVTPGNSVIIMGPNGSGKSSILRVLAELWSLHSGTITKPPPEEIFYLSQRPYLLRGSLRDQVCYPELNKGRMDISCKHGSDWRDSSVLPCNHSDDNRILEVLEATEISYLVDRGYGLDKVQNWEEILSGGERQRLAVSRLLYHSPRFAVLDECTSAVSVDGEEKLYKTLHNHGITMLSVAHRPAVMRFHSACLYIDGSQTEIGWKFEKLTAGISS